MFLEFQYVQKPGKLVIEAIPANSLDLVTQLIFELPGTLERGRRGSGISSTELNMASLYFAVTRCESVKKEK